MTGILGMARLLVDENLTSTQHDMLNDLIKAAERLSDFIDKQVLANPIEESKPDYFKYSVCNKATPTLFIRLVDNNENVATKNAVYLTLNK